MNILFKKPPLSEIVLGIQFNGSKFDPNHINAIVNLFSEQYPKLSEVTPLPSIIDSPKKPRIAQVQKVFSSRKHLVDESNCKVIQLQHDRILFNWRALNPKVDYPHYNKMIEGFLSVLNEISHLLSIDLSESINQYEFTYFDHIKLKDFSLDTFELSRILSIVHQGLEMKNVNFEYAIPYDAIGGVVNTSIKSGVDNKSQQKVVVLDNTCRGFVPKIGIKEWFDSAHQILTNNFQAMISDEAKEIWGYEEVNE